MNKQQLEDLVLKLQFFENKEPFLLDITSLLYDFELLYDLVTILTYPDYSGYPLTRYFWYRKGRATKPEHKIRTLRIIKESPLIIEIILGGVGAFWALIQALEKVGNWRLNRKKLKLEIEILELERDIDKNKLGRSRLDLESTLEERKAFEIFRRLIQRLESNPIKLLDLSLSKRKKQSK